MIWITIVGDQNHTPEGDQSGIACDHNHRAKCERSQLRSPCFLSIADMPCRFCGGPWQGECDGLTNPHMAQRSPEATMSFFKSRDFGIRPLLVIWEVTRACDLQCVHSRASAQPKRHALELS